ncbi:MAG: restriction endonuclease subunit S, partial [Proteobacteria bacterium]|nr:restriction endonuclease subunit S [Pseudomonadota bacterium]
MVDEWLRVPLGNAATLKRGYDLPERDRRPGSFRVISSAGPFTTHHVAAESGPGVVTGRYGTIGRVYYSTDDYWPLNTTLFVTDFHGNHQRFIYYLMHTIDYQASSDKSSVPGVNRNDLHREVVGIPPLPEQRAIAHVLGAIDDKIDLNRRMAATLEEMARALFTSWFVRFDPVRAKMAGQPTGLPAHIEALFPDALVDSELGEVPEGWGVCQVRDIADLAGGGTPATSNPLYWDPGIHHWATPKDLAILATPVLLSTGRRISDAGLASISSGLLPVGTILMSSRAPIGYVAVTHVPTAVNQGFIAMLPRAEHFAMFLKHWVIASQELIVSHANGSTFLEISKASFRPLPVISPPPVLLVRFQLAAG